MSAFVSRAASAMPPPRSAARLWPAAALLSPKYALTPRLLRNFRNVDEQRDPGGGVAAAPGSGEWTSLKGRDGLRIVAQLRRARELVEHPAPAPELRRRRHPDDVKHLGPPRAPV